MYIYIRMYAREHAAARHHACHRVPGLCIAKPVLARRPLEADAAAVLLKELREQWLPLSHTYRR